MAAHDRLNARNLQILYTCLSQCRAITLDRKHSIGVVRAELLHVLLLLVQLPRAQKDLSRRELSKRNHRTDLSVGRRVGRRARICTCIVLIGIFSYIISRYLEDGLPYRERGSDAECCLPKQGKEAKVTTRAFIIDQRRNLSATVHSARNINHSRTHYSDFNDAAQISITPVV